MRIPARLEKAAYAAIAAAALLGGAPAGRAQEAAPANEQVIEPQVERRDVQVPHIPSNDIELGVFTGAYNAENFGAHIVEGVRAGYHITESVFVEAAYGRTKVSDQLFRLFLPGGVFPVPNETLQYYDLSAGYNLFPGEIFLSRSHAKVSTIYLIAGLGTTKFDAASHLTVNGGLGTRIFMADWVAIQFDMRDHFFSQDILGARQNTQNLEFTVGMTFFF